MSEHASYYDLDARRRLLIQPDAVLLTDPDGQQRTSWCSTTYPVRVHHRCHNAGCQCVCHEREKRGAGR